MSSSSSEEEARNRALERRGQEEPTGQQHLKSGSQVTVFPHY